jgi:hypothetical protein
VRGPWTAVNACESLRVSHKEGQNFFHTTAKASAYPRKQRKNVSGRLSPPLGRGGREINSWDSAHAR